MYIVITVSFIALFLTFQEKSRKLRNGMKYGFVLLTLLGAIHYNYGTDYRAYHNLYTVLIDSNLEFQSLLSLDFESLSEEGNFKDPGWIYLCKIFSYLGGFFMMVAVLNIIQNIIVYRFIKSEVNKRWWPMAVFIYLFVTSYYVLNFSMMRQGFVVCVFLGMWQYIKTRKWWIPLFILFLCSFIHASAIILIPFSFGGYLPTNKGKFWAIILGGLFIVMWGSKQFLHNLYSSMMILENIEKYSEIYDNGNKVSFGIGYIINIIPFFLTLYYLYKHEDTNQNRQLVLLSSFSFLILPFAQIIPLITRVSYYFGIYQIAAFPLIYSSIRNRILRLLYILIFVSITLFSYWSFFNHGVYVKGYRTFHTIFEAI